MNVAETDRMVTPAVVSSQQAGYRPNRLYILPTRYGFMFFLTLFFILLGAVNYNSSMGYMLCFLLSSVVLNCMFHSYLNLFCTQLQVGIPAPVYAGETPFIPVCIFRLPSVRQRGAYSVVLKLRQRGEEPSTGKWNRFWRTAPVEGEIMASFAPGAEVSVLLPCTPRQRGCYPLQRFSIRVESSFPLGLFYCWWNCSAQQIQGDVQTMVIYPRPAGNPELLWQTVSGVGDAKGASDGIEDFVGLRKYRAGDSIASIVWRTVAQEQELMIRDFVGRGARQWIFSWEQTAHLSDVETRLSQLCLWLLEADREGVPFGLSLPGSDIAPDYGKLHLQQCLRALALFGK